MATDPYATQKQQQTTKALAALAALYAASKADVVHRIGLGHLRDALLPRWRDLLQSTVATQSQATAALFAATVIKDMDGPLNDFNPDQMSAYLDVFATEFSKAWEAATNEALNMIDLNATDLEKAAAEVMDAVAAQATNDADNIVQRAGHFGLIEGGGFAGATHKTWHTGTDPRATHAALDGVTIPLDDRFANGLRYPGSPGPPAEVANCNCSLTVGRGA